jgi:hypothetical protein
MTALFVIERWCDCNPACGISGPQEYYLNTWRRLGFGRTLAYHYDGRPVEESTRDLLAITNHFSPEIVFYTEVGGHPSAQLHDLWPQVAAKGIPIVAIWHDTVHTGFRQLSGIALNVLVDATFSVHGQNALCLWTPHDTSLFCPGHMDRDIDVLFPSSRNHKPLAQDWIAHVERSGISVNWVGGQRENRHCWYEYSTLFQRAKIVINFAQNTHGGFEQLKGRVTEATYCGCLLLEQMNRYTPQMFTPNEECVYFDSKQTLLEKLRYYLEHDNERTAIAKCGRERAIVQYSPRAWWRRVLEAAGKPI